MNKTQIIRTLTNWGRNIPDVSEAVPSPYKTPVNLGIQSRDVGHDYAQTTNNINKWTVKQYYFVFQAFSEITKWIFLIEGIGIIILNSMLILLLSKRKKPNRMAFFVSHLAVAGNLI